MNMNVCACQLYSSVVNSKCITEHTTDYWYTVLNCMHPIYTIWHRDRLNITDEYLWAIFSNFISNFIHLRINSNHGASNRFAIFGKNCRAKIFYVILRDRITFSYIILIPAGCFIYGLNLCGGLSLG